MGAIAEINLPKGQSMCTRCPTNIKTSPADTWRCTVSLQYTHTFEPTRKQGQAFPNWRETDVLESVLFKEIHDKRELEEVLTWAQIALLNPSKGSESFVPGSREQQLKKDENDNSIEAQFSPNVIAVEIRGPGLPALSFFDLPGLFQAAADQRQQFLVKVFEDLTVKYITHPNAIVICTITMQNDPSLSRTKALITKYKAEKKTIGVLTMPDRLQASSAHKDYDNILHRKTYVLPRGYFVTKQPGPDSQLPEENYHNFARLEEEDFFDSHPQWGQGGSWEAFRDRCGTSTIRKYLFKEFAKQILESIPDLTDKINAQTQEVESELASLPETPNDRVQHIVRQKLTAFSNEVRRIFDGTSLSNNNKLHSEFTMLCRQFLKATEVMRPGLICDHPSDKIREIITIDDSDGESVVSQITPVSQYREGSEGPSKKRPRVIDTPIPLNLSNGNGGSGRFGNPANRSMKRENAFVPMQPPMRSALARKLKAEEIGPFRQSYLDSGFKFMSIGDIKDSIEKNSRAGFPERVSDKVMEQFTLQAVCPWDKPLRTFVEHTFAMLREQILSTLASVLRDHQYTELYRRSQEFVEEFLSSYENDQQEVSMDFYNVEKSGLFTINEEVFNRHKADALVTLREHRRKWRVECYTGRHFRYKFNDERDTASKDEFMKKVKDEQLGHDPFERELDVAAWIRGYYTTARFRFTDSVCANIHNKCFKKIASDINYLLEEKLGLDQGDAEATCQALLEGNAQRRIQLKNKRDQLAEFSRTLDEL
jgi:hypothetical protein